MRLIKFAIVGLWIAPLLRGCGSEESGGVEASLKSQRPVPREWKVERSEER
jgi:hypothetical protein